MSFVAPDGSTNFKVVYCGPGLCGKTTNIQHVYDKTPAANKGKLISLATETDRTLFFQFDPPTRGSFGTRPVRLHLYTVPGPVFYDVSRQLILKGVDGVVFVADSQEVRAEANVKSIEQLESNLALQGIELATFPFAIQYNKRDLPTALPVVELEAVLNPAGRPHFEAIAFKGRGVFETLDSVWSQVLARHDADGAR